MKKGVLKNSAKFTRKHLCQSLFLNEVVPSGDIFSKFDVMHFKHLQWDIDLCWFLHWFQRADSMQNKSFPSRISLTNMTKSAWKVRLSIKNFYSKCDQIRKKLQIWSHLLKKFLMENLIFWAVGIFIKFENLRFWFEKLRKWLVPHSPSGKLWMHLQAMSIKDEKNADHLRILLK